MRGVCGSGLVRGALPDSCFRWKEPPVPRARPSEVPGGLLERRDWTQAGVMWVSWRARGLHWHLTPAIPPKDRLYLLRAESNPGRRRKTANVPRRRGVHLRLCASGSLASDAQFGPLLAQDRHIRIAASPRVTVIFQRPGFPRSFEPQRRRKKPNAPNRQLSKLSARPAAPPGRPARGFRTNIPTHTSMRAPPAPPEPPNQT